VFTIITLVSFFGLIFSLLFHHSRRMKAQAKGISVDSKTRSYIPWLFNQLSRIFKSSSLSWQKMAQFLRIQQYPEKERWIFLSLIASFVFLVASGFIPAMFIRRGLYGFLLLLHIGFGGIFAISLSIIVVLRARVYSFQTGKTMSNDSSAELKELTPSYAIMQKILFWLFIIAGLLLIVSALAQMLPFFSLNSQIALTEVHRYAALVSLLSAIAFAYITLTDGFKR